VQAREDEAQRDLLVSLPGPDAGWEVHVVEFAGAVGGFMAIQMKPETLVGEIGLNAVHPTHAGHGIWPALYEFALSRMKAAGMRAATVATGGAPSHVPARRAYERRDSRRRFPACGSAVSSSGRRTELPPPAGPSRPGVNAMSWAIFSLLVILGDPALAQGPAAGRGLSPTRLDSVFASVPIGSSVRLESVDTQVVTGIFLRTSEAGVVLDTGTGEAVVRPPILAVWLQRPATGGGARIGALVGGLALGLWTIAFAEGDCDARCVAPFAIGAALAGGGIGALAGAATGSLVRVWRRVLP
jgi:Acetyltransferase (GNAT) family